MQNEHCLCLDLPKVVFFCKVVFLAAYFWPCSACVCVLLSTACFVSRLLERKMNWVWLTLGMFSKQNLGWVFGLFWLALETESRAQIGWVDSWIVAAGSRNPGLRLQSSLNWGAKKAPCYLQCQGNTGRSCVGAVLALQYRSRHLFSTCSLCISTHRLVIKQWFGLEGTLEVT